MKKHGRVPAEREGPVTATRGRSCLSPEAFQDGMGPMGLKLIKT